MNNSFTSTARFIGQLALTIGLIMGAYVMSQPFLLPIITATVIALVVKPAYEWLRHKGCSTGLSALIVLITLILLILLPLAFVTNLLISEVGAVTTLISHSGTAVDSLSQHLQELGKRFDLPVDQFNLRAYLLHVLSLIGDRAGTVLGGVLGVFGDIVLVLFGVFYILHGMPQSRRYIDHISPLNKEDTESILHRIEEVVQATVRGNIVVIAIQGIVFTIAGYIFGLPAPVLLGLLYGVTSVIPVIGTSIVWIPIVLFLLSSGDYASALGITIWALGEIAVIDHVIAPRLIGQRTRLNPFLTLIGVLGGVSHFGLLGFIIGPTAMALGVVGLEMLSRIWRGGSMEDLVD